MKTFKHKLGLLGLICTTMLFILVASCREDAKKGSADGNKVDITPVSEKMTKTPATETSETSEAIAKNPAHGQPGHRCDIPVGAPLNSPPANTNSATPLNTNSGAANPKINPPHGQPGHRCDVKVGDPL
ncbi:hypothetical protein [Aureitalea sp. L0-47]|uniref:hypothetical protein n=1 Tax=Aureitalea sp. L0-47 TaxID=2816962 RepID=UPI0022383D91|nr:hypothetical protein [Aureitalea sp. L0-47]